MREDIEWLKANSEGIGVRSRLDGLEQFVRKGEYCRAAVWGRYSKYGVLLATTERVLFHVPGAPEASGAEYDAVETVEVHQVAARSLTLHVFARTFDLAVQGITDTTDLLRVVGVVQEGVDQANVAAGRLARFAGITVTASEVRSEFGSGPLVGARADVDTGGSLTRRPRIGYVLAFGVLGLAASKTVDQRELYLSVEGQAFGFAIQLPPWRVTEARSFASQLNGAQVGAVAQAPAVAATSGPADPFEQVRKLAELRDAKLISNDQFEAKRAEILSRI
jgi:hypothetical protein